MSQHGASILVVDDDQEIIRLLQRSLTAHGYLVHIAHSGSEATRAVAQQRFDLLLIEPFLLDARGLAVCRQIRAISQVPMIVLSNRDTEYDKVEALDLGADDYIVKPFGIDEVLARVRVALRLAIQPLSGAAPCFHAGPLSIDFAHRRVEIGRQGVALTPTEFDLLKIFIIHRGEVLTRQMLTKEIWGAEGCAEIHKLQVYTAQLRKKIEPAPTHPAFLLTIPGIGYRFNNADES